MEQKWASKRKQDDRATQDPFIQVDEGTLGGVLYEGTPAGETAAVASGIDKLIPRSYAYVESVESDKYDGGPRNVNWVITSLEHKTGLSMFRHTERGKYEVWKDGRVMGAFETRDEARVWLEDAARSS
jgi:hypothetical protein